MSNATAPLVSAVIPSYNTANTIGRAIQSVAGTGYENLEIVVVDDGSSDESLNQLRTLQDSHRELNLRVYTHAGRRNRGIGRTRNLGIRRALGEYLVFLDADDMFLPNRFTSCIELLESNLELDAVWEPFEYVMESGKRTGSPRSLANAAAARIVVPDMNETTGDHLLDSLHGYRPVHITSVTIRKSTFDHTGVFPPLRYCLELALWYRIFARKRTVQAGHQPVSRYFVHAGSHISRNEDSADFAFDTIRALIHGFRWMRRNKSDRVYVEAFRRRIVGKWMNYCSCVLDKHYSFMDDIVFKFAMIGVALPQLLVSPRYWKAGVKLTAAHLGLAEKW